MKIVLPFPVSVNKAYGQSSGRRRFKSEKYTSWLMSCPRLPELNLESANIEYRFWFPDNRVRDTANGIKVMDDYMVSQGLLKDDNWHIIKSQLLLPMGIDRENPRVEIIIE